MHVALIRPAHPDEAAAVLELWRLAGNEPTPTDDLETVRALAARGDGSLLVAELDGALVGTLIAAWDGWRGSFYRLAVAPGRRRGGIAAALVAEGERSLRERGAVRATAIVLDGHDDAIGFWEAAGYERHAGVRRYRRLLG